MTNCEKCGADKRRWPRSCPRCRAGRRREKAAGGAADLALPAGVLEWLWRGVAGAARAVLRAFT
ncbi:hypothetical protein [Streptomyces zingiberis]|uniref:Uncharacterized protein n=1 Tax=Streptomyces zingiberis TaxID=2053010 RepID=A0ABX1C5F0_9ACTN|nr:hypothetical protein [Streptomyces zingiberis]NJQ02164.1 hypothetical protein [Streptomyces zingiberis]